MKEITEDKGRVRPVVEGDFQCDENGNSTRFYEILSIIGYIKDDGTKIGYISKTDVPIGTPITNTDYWYPFQVIGVPKGDKGDKGNPGVDGKSAYELYIEHGGTIVPEEAWIASLQGKDGKDAQPLMLRVSADGQSLEISDDGGQTWYLFQKNFNKLRVLGYVDDISKLPKVAEIGDIYGVLQEHVEPGEEATYILYINTVKDWLKDYTITKVYDYDTELPSSAIDGTTVLVPVDYLTLDKQKIDGYKVYRFVVDRNGWVLILDTAEIYASKNDIINRGDNKFALVQGEEPNTYDLYRRDVGWVYFGTNVSITYVLVQNIEDGTSTNILSGEAVKLKFAEFAAALDAFKQEVKDTYGDYEENSEFVRVTLDNNNKVLYGVQTNGNFYFGAGVPQQVIDYVEGKIAELSLDEYEDIVAFLNDLEKGDKTLQNLLDEKVDKEEGKSLIDSEYASTKSTVDNTEFLDVTIDAEDKVLEGLQTDGTKVIGGGLNVGGSANINGDLRVLGKMEVSGVSYKVIENPEYLAAWVDASDKIIFGFKADGKTYIGDADFLDDVESIKAFLANFNNKNIDWDALTSITATENPEFMEVELDAEDKVLGGRKVDGTRFENVGFSTPKVSIDGHTLENTEDPEGRSEIITDAEGKIISYRDANGVKHEEVGVETNKLTLSEEGLSDLENALKASGFSGDQSDWSDSEFVEIPIPKVCAIINIEVNSQAEAKGLDIPTHIQFWDKYGNYFRKPIELNAQGASSMAYHIKNQAIDFTDGSKIKFGNWPAFDSFHIKKYFIDVFRGQCIVAYWLTEQMYQTRTYGEKRPWDYLNQFSDYDKSNGSFAKDFESGAMAHPDGFPVHLFFNGKDAGIYAFNIKKDRSNYNCKKNNKKQIILDGILGSTFWTANGDMTIAGEEDPNQNLWHDFEIRNPKISKDINGNKYDGDNPKEPSDDYATTKAAIARLTTAISSVAAESSTADKKAKFAEFFNIPFFIDYELISQVIYNYDGYRKNWIWCTWDGILWCPTSYDMDSIFGQHWNGASYVQNSTTEILGGWDALPTGSSFLKGLYGNELRNRYKELRDNGIFTVDNIVRLLDKWVKGCGYDNLKHDIEDIVTSPYIENGSEVVDSQGNPILIPNTPSYRDGEKTYVYPPTSEGWYNSIQRVKNWLIQRINNLDNYYNYSQG